MSFRSEEKVVDVEIMLFQIEPHGLVGEAPILRKNHD